MSKLDHAKRVSKRFLKLAKTFPENKIEVNSLSDAFKYVSVINGYNDWHDYQENLIRQDYIANNELPKKYSQINDSFDELYQKMPSNNMNIPQLNIINYTINKQEKVESKPIYLGQGKIKKTFEKIKHHYLTEYPILLSGSTGAGKTESLISLGAQYIEREEGLIYIDGKGDNTLYSKLFSICHEYKRIDDLYIINFNNYNKDKKKKSSNLIDPINPFIGYEKELKNLLGDFVGSLVNLIGLQLKEENKGVNIEVLESITSLPSLINLYKMGFFNEKISAVLIDYFTNDLNIKDIINFDIDDNSEEVRKNIFKNHISKFNKLKLFINMINLYQNVFSVENSEISFNEVYANKKIMCVLLPALQKNPDEFSMLLDIVVSQIHISSKYFDNQDNTQIYQNVIVDEITYSLSNEMCKNFMFDLPKSTHWLFGIQDFGGYSANNKIDYIISKCNTFAFMKCEDVSSIPDKLIGKILRNTNTNHALFSRPLDLKYLRPGESWVFQNKTLELLIFGYKKIEKTDYIFIPNGR